MRSFELGRRIGGRTAFVYLLLFLLSSIPLALAFEFTSPERMIVGQVYDNQLLVPTNQVLSLIGSRVQIAGWPLDLALSPNGERMAVLMADGIQILSPDGALLRRIGLQKTSFAGLVFTPDGQKVLAAELGKTDSLIAADPVTGEIGTVASFAGGSLPAGVAVSQRGDRIYVALNGRDSVAAIDGTSGTILTASTGVAPFGIALTPDGGRLFVSNWGGRQPSRSEMTAASGPSRVLVDARGIASNGTVSVFDAMSLTLLKEITVGLHPGALQVSPDGRLLVVANSNSDSITLVDTETLDIVDTVPIGAFPEGYLGSSPTAVAFSPSGRWLYVACGGNNAVAVLERVRRRPAVGDSGVPNSGGRVFRLRGHVPVDWYPIALAVLAGSDGNDTVFAANAKGFGLRRGGARSNVKTALGTVVSFGGGRQSVSTSTVSSSNNPFVNASRQTEVEDLKTLGIRHVFYIIKENRTYDQILGDLGRGNGDPFLTHYGWNVTSNHHRLARDFVTLDNFYTSGMVSSDGHQWVTQSMVTDYLERAFGRWPRSYPFKGDDPLAFASTGFLWDNAQRSGLSVRVFGEFAVVNSGGARSWLDYVNDAMTAKHKLSVNSHSSIAAMNSITESSYPGWALNIPDIYRASIFREKLRGFERRHDLPNLVIIFLPGDHTAGLQRGYPRPPAMVADNDLALGQIVEAITRTSDWPQSAIFVTEDDSQDGVDHVDGHRTVGLVISPFVKRGEVDSIHYNQTSMIRTIEELLGMPPMNKFDAAALPMRSLFTYEPDFQPFGATVNHVLLNSVITPAEHLDPWERAAVAESMAMDFSRPDAAPEDKLNRILWRAAKGLGVPYPRVLHRWSCTPNDDER